MAAMMELRLVARTAGSLAVSLVEQKVKQTVESLAGRMDNLLAVD